MGHACYAQGYAVRHPGSSQQLRNEKELLFKKENHQLKKVNSKVPKIGADNTESLFKVSLRSHAAAVGPYAVSRKNSYDGKICYSCSPPGRERGNFSRTGLVLAFLTTNGKAKVKSFGERGRLSRGSHDSLTPRGQRHVEAFRHWTQTL